MVRGQLVVGFGPGRVRVGVDDGRGEPADVVQQPMLGVVGNAVGVDHRQLVVDDDLALRAQGVADPADPSSRQTESR
jgi:hypothetical protein